MHHPTDRIAHTTAFVIPVVEHWMEREIAQWVHPMKDRSDDPSHHERTLLPRSYISLSNSESNAPTSTHGAVEARAGLVVTLTVLAAVRGGALALATLALSPVHAHHRRVVPVEQSIHVSLKDTLYIYIYI